MTGDDRACGEVAFEATLEQARGPFAPEVERLRREAPRDVGGRERALSSLPVYRTYVEPWSGAVADAIAAGFTAAGVAGAGVLGIGGARRRTAGRPLPW